MTISNIVPVVTAFTWGEVKGRIFIPIGPKGERVCFVKHHPWIVVKSQVRTGLPDYSVVAYYCEATCHTDHSLEASLLRYITQKNLGQNNGALVAGILRALDVKAEVPEGEVW